MIDEPWDKSPLYTEPLEMARRGEIDTLEFAMIISDFEWVPQDVRDHWAEEGSRHYEQVKLDHPDGQDEG